MENYQSSYGIMSRWLKAKDLIYPCNSVAEKYKFYCYDLVTARILPKVNYNWKKAAAWCRKSEKNWVKVCFQSMGRDASGYTRLDPPAIIKICRNAKDMAGECIYAAGKDMTYTDVSARRAKVLCNTAPDSTRDYCWHGIGEILGSLNRETEKRKASCDEATATKPRVPRRLLPRRRDYLAQSVSLQNAGMVARPVLAALVSSSCSPPAAAGRGMTTRAARSARCRGRRCSTVRAVAAATRSPAAKSKGTVGPNLDQLRPDAQTVARQVKNGGVGMPSFAKKLNEVQISQVAEFVSESTRSSTMGGSVAAGFKPDDTKIADCKPTDFHCYEQAFANISYKDGPKTALDEFDKDIKTPGPIERDCHRIAHAIGAGALSHFHGNIGQAFVAGRPSCTSGYYHGILERAFLGVPQSQLGAKARAFCSSPEVRKSEFIAYQCVHGLGHGLMIYTGYDLPALAAHVRQAPTGRPAELHGRRLHGELPVVVRRHVALAEGEGPHLSVQLRRREVQVLLLRPGDGADPAQGELQLEEGRGLVPQEREELGQGLLPVDGPRRIRVHTARPGAHPQNLPQRERHGP